MALLQRTVLANRRRPAYVLTMSQPPDEDRLNTFLASVGRDDSFGVFELNEALGVLCNAKLEAGLHDISQIERFWTWPELTHSQAGFVLLLHDERRAYLDVWVEQTGLVEEHEGDFVEVVATKPPKTDIELEILPAGKREPDFQSTAEPLGGWRKDVNVLNDLLSGIWQRR